MGVDYSGWMLIGEFIDKLEMPKKYQDDNEDMDWGDLAEELEMEISRPYYDACYKDSVIGFEIPDISVKDIDAKWMEKLKEKGKEFEEIFGVVPELIGIQDIF